MLKFLKVLFRIVFNLDRIATAIEKLAGIEKGTKLKSKDFKGYAITEEELIEQEDEETSRAITNRLISAESEGNTNFFVEDTIRDLLEEVNET